MSLAQVVELAPSATDEPAPQISAHSRLHRHAQIGAVNRGPHMRLSRQPAQLFALATRKLLRRGRREERQPTHATSNRNAWHCIDGANVIRSRDRASRTQIA